MAERIDIHAHYVPPFYKDALIAAGHSKPDGMPAIPPWTVEAHLDLMKKCSISKSILSITAPGSHLTPQKDVEARQLARQCNEYAADLKKTYPANFGFWATLPLPDIQGSITEAAYALDHLNADGVTILTNSHGVYLGDQHLEPLMLELNKRKAKIFIHPASPCSCSERGVQAATPLFTQYPNPVFEFFFDSSRAVINLFLSRTIQKFPDITYIMTHAGGVLPPLIERFTSFGSTIVNPPVHLSAEDVRNIFQRQFYFDLAGFPFPAQMRILQEYVSPEKIVYGTDFPFTPAPAVVKLAQTMDAQLGIFVEQEDDRRGIYTCNAERLLGILQK